MILSLYGEQYDVSAILSWHPGGASILRQVRALRQPDHTPLFESMHALRDAEEMRRKLLPFRIERHQNRTASQLYSFDDTGFYRVVRKRVAAALKPYGSPGPHGSTGAPKGGFDFVVNLVVRTACALATLWLSVRAPTAALAGLYALCAGFFVCTVTFGCLHDASHFSAFTRAPDLTEAVSRFTQHLEGWDHNSWRAHHLLSHHPFTGDVRLDPDTRHGADVWCKTDDEYVCRSAGPTLQFALALSNLMTGQVLAYALLRHVWGYVPPDGDGYVPREQWLHARASSPHFTNGNSILELRGIAWEPWSWWEPAMALYVPLWLIAHWYLHAGGERSATADATACSSVSSTHADAGASRTLSSVCAPWARWSERWRRLLRPSVAFWAFVASLNLFYSMNILIDHDAIDTHELVHSPSLTNDWGEIQVRATANWAGPIWCFFFGGINYQIEHHLFPTVYHRYLPLIAPIVRQTADEFGIPYVHFESVGVGLAAVLAQFRAAWSSPLRAQTQRHAGNTFLGWVMIGFLALEAAAVAHVICFAVVLPVLHHVRRPRSTTARVSGASSQERWKKAPHDRL